MSDLHDLSAENYFAQMMEHRALKAEAQVADQEAEIARLRTERDEYLEALERHGFRRCDAPACNCNGWHGGFSAARLVEIGDTLTDAGIDLDGTTIRGGVMKALQLLAGERSARTQLEDRIAERVEVWRRLEKETLIPDTRRRANRMAKELAALLAVSSPQLQETETKG